MANKSCFKLIFLLLFLSIFGNCYDNSTLVNAPAGNFTGKVLKFDEGNVTEYLGIPFAHPPIKDHRFSPPLLINYSDPQYKYEAFPAVHLARSCVQYTGKYNFSGYDEFIPTNNISEDCLQLNMWVPQNRTGTVIVFIFGGGYNFGSPSLDLYNGSILSLFTQAIVVNLNYRLGIFGFGYLGDGTDVKGNMGFLDQQIGLQWIHENIGAFGGNNTNITLFGESAGAASVTAHLFSNKSYPYFSKLIASSGVITNDWATINQNIAVNNTLEVAKKLNCSVNNTEKTIECLRNVTWSDLLIASLNVSNSPQSVAYYPFTPIDNDTVFFNGSVKERHLNNKTKNSSDIIFGRTADEATYFMPSLLKMFNCTFNSTLNSTALENQCLLNETHYQGIVQWIGNITGFNCNETKLLEAVYNTTRTNKTRGKVAELLSDFLFDCKNALFAQWYYNVTQKNIYFFEFRKRSPLNPWPKWMGAMHGGELSYFFGHPFRYPHLYNDSILEKEKNFTRKLMDNVKVFVESGDLGERWRKFNATAQKALVIGENFTETSNGTFYNETYVNALSRTCKNLTSIFYKFKERKTAEYFAFLEKLKQQQQQQH